MFGLIIVAIGVAVAIGLFWRRLGEDENMTFGRDTPAKQANRATRRAARLARDSEWQSNIPRRDP